MTALLAISRVIDAVNTFIHKWIRWFILIAVIVSAANAMSRKFLNVSSNAWLEVQWYLFGAVFMLCAAYTFLKNEHVRIDIVLSRFSRRTQNWIELVGHLIFLMPFVILLFIESRLSFLSSYRSGEISSNAGGLIIWPAKAFIVIGFAMMFFQGVSEIIKRIAVIRGVIEDPHAVTDDEPAEVKLEGA
ncbi:C4-dicarboxylate ABC transporter [Agaricicola taiwanensis]|uniref:TRAP transporter small permease protein n=1 Tax=Agaricicola taiwanensis TaxID=591372 RepID=A0A8J2VR54_9RHOB|nr:TRAP transporter small permease subunit [Agaricicola taiwanensis]GGE37393.1 C4-dicarboxylate ABC transporter [Agaricicola taiwanensis]